MRKARVVVIGGGIAGASTAYRLAELGWEDILVLEQGASPRGATRHTPGLVYQLSPDDGLTKLLVDSIALYKKLRFEGRAGFIAVGSLRLASSRERLLELKRDHSRARALGLEARLLMAHEVKPMYPLLDPAGLQGALWFPTDGTLAGPHLLQALVKAAKSKGVEFLYHKKVVGFDKKDGRVIGVVTPEEDILCETVVLAAGVWNRELGRLIGANLPLIALQRQCMQTAPLAEVTALGVKALPNLHDPDHRFFLQQDHERLLLGGWEREPAAFFHDKVPAESSLMPFSPARFEEIQQGGAKRVPLLAKAEQAFKISALEDFTPDALPIVGPIQALHGLWIIGGFCGRGVAAAGAAGAALADWIVTNEHPFDLWSVDSRRFGDRPAKTGFVSGRAREAAGRRDDIAYPRVPFASERDQRVSSLHKELQSIGAVFAEAGGWERPQWFSHNELGADTTHVPSGWAAKNWSPAIVAEHRACRESAALFDLSSRAKFELTGEGASAFLDKLTGGIEAEGTAFRAIVRNARGGVECDMTVLRLSANHFRLLMDAERGPRSWNWIDSRRPRDGTAMLRDVTDDFCCLGLWGPKSREILSALCPGDLSHEGFPLGAARVLRVSGLGVLGARVSQVGELGWELHAPMKEGPKLWEAIMEAGKPLGIRPAGYRALETLRLEKGDFPMPLVCLTLDDPAVQALGGEAITQNSRVVGRVELAGFGYTVGKSIVYGSVAAKQSGVGMKLEIELFGERALATVVESPLYDPRGERVTI